MESASRVARTDPDDDLILPLCSIFRRYLKRQSLKFTPERAKILDAVMEKEGVFEADELADELRQRGHRVSKATIYRTLKHLKDAGIITEVLIDSKQAHYEQSFGKKAKGHLVCAETNQIIEFDISSLEAFCKQVCEEHGFEPVGHRFVIYGVSPEARQGDDDE